MIPYNNSNEKKTVNKL